MLFRSADGEAEVFFPNLDENHAYEISKILPEVEDEGYKTSLYVYTKIEELIRE